MHILHNNIWFLFTYIITYNGGQTVCTVSLLNIFATFRRNSELLFPKYNLKLPPIVMFFLLLKSLSKLL